MEKADELFGKINELLTNNTISSENGTNSPDDDGLPYESFDDFSTEPVEFGEMAERMLRKVENLFDLTAVCNRHSGKYLKACNLLEKGIKFLGSACITKSALEREKISFPELGQLTTMKLYRMASFNYRKLDAALSEKLQQCNDLYPELLDMEFSYFNLLRRLRSTETKIHNYHYHRDYGSLNRDPVREGTAFSADSWTKYCSRKQEESPVFRQAPAFPLIKSSSAFGVQRSEKSSGQRDGSRLSRSLCGSNGQHIDPENAMRLGKKGIVRSVQNERGDVRTQYPVFNTQRNPETGNEDRGANSEGSVSDSEAAFKSRFSAFSAGEENPNSEFRIPHSETRKSIGTPLITEIPDGSPEKLYERLKLRYERNLRSDPVDPSCFRPSDERNSTQDPADDSG